MGNSASVVDHYELKLNYDKIEKVIEEIKSNEVKFVYFSAFHKLMNLETFQSLLLLTTQQAMLLQEKNHLKENHCIVSVQNI